MSEIRNAKFTQPIKCKCGKLLSHADVRAIGDTIDIVCSACHSSVAEIEFEQQEAERWD